MTEGGDAAAEPVPAISLDKLEMARRARVRRQLGAAGVLVAAKLFGDEPEPEPEPKRERRKRKFKLRGTLWT
jgi:hypothetical protein